MKLLFSLIVFSVFSLSWGKPLSILKGTGVELAPLDTSRESVFFNLNISYKNAPAVLDAKKSLDLTDINTQGGNLDIRNSSGTPLNPRSIYITLDSYNRKEESGTFNLGISLETPSLSKPAGYTLKERCRSCVRTCLPFRRKTLL